jgi:hypothetical protein
MGDLDRNLAAVLQVGGAEDRGHAAAGSEVIDAVVIELIARMECSHRESTDIKRARPTVKLRSSLYQVIMPELA